MFNYDLLIGRIKNSDNKLTYTSVAKACHMSVATLKRRLSGEPFTTKEIMEISNQLGLSDSDWGDYFFKLKRSV